MPSQTPLQLFLNRLRHRTIGSSENPLSDAQLLDRFVSTRDEAAFELLVWRHGGMVLGLCRRLVRQAQDAEDAFQATFLTLAQKAESIHKREAMASWLYRVAYRIALAARRRAAECSCLEGPVLDDLPAADVEDHGCGEFQRMLDEEVQRLPEKYRAAFVLCQLEGKTMQEAAALLGCPTGTVLSRLSRARERLRCRLIRRGVSVAALLISTACVGSATAATVTWGLVHQTVKAGLAIAAGQAIRSAATLSVAALTEGAMRAMFMSQLKVAAAAVLTVGLLGVGAAGAWALAAGSGTTPDDKPAAQSPAPPNYQGSGDELQAARHRKQIRKNLQAIVRGLHTYADVNNGLLPPPASVDKKGTRLLSWRVLILPYIGEEKLHEQFHLDEPWDSKHNKELLAKMPEVFSTPRAKDRNRGMTHYLAIVGPGAAFEEGKELKIPDFLDGTSNTIGFIEAEKPVPWTKPEDFAYDPEKPLSIPSRDFHAARMDSSSFLISKDADEMELRNLITRAGGEVVDNDKIDAHIVVPKDLKAGASELRRTNEQIQQAMAKAQEELAKSLDELNALRVKGADKHAMAAENAKLRKKLDGLLDQLELIRKEIEELKKDEKKP